MREPHSDTERIVAFLHENSHRAWRTETIAERLGLGTDDVNAIVSRLRDRDLLCREGSCWRITDDEERLRAAYRIHRYHEAADDQYGEERFEALRTDGTERVS